MQSSRIERPEQLTIEVGRWSASLTTILVTVVFVLVVGMLANSVRKNNDRADDWQRRAVAAEEIVGGLRVVLADRSRALNERTRQANALVDTLASSRGALRATKSNVGSLARRQRQLASDKARVEAELRKLRAQRATLRSVGSALSACSQDLESIATAKPRPSPATTQSTIASCDRAQARFEAAQEQLR
jgi:chromosome segregation ATPase